MSTRGPRRSHRSKNLLEAAGAGTVTAQSVEDRAEQADGSAPALSLGGLLGWAGGLVAALFLACLALAGSGIIPSYRGTTVSVACTLTGCSLGGIAVLGWLLVLVPVLLWCGVLMWWDEFRDLRARSQVTLLIAGVVLLLAPVPFLPGDGDPSLEYMFPDDSGRAFTYGLFWGGVAVLLGPIVAGLGRIALLNRDAKSRRGPVVAVVLTLVVVAGAAVAGTAKGHVVGYRGSIITTGILDDRLFVQEDVMTRFGDADYEGCDAKYAGCRHTAELWYTTDDSDAFVHLDIITFPSNDEAWVAWELARRSTGSPAQLRVANVTGTWLLVSTVMHTGGRDIQAAEEPWLRWPPALLEYRFRAAIDSPMAYPPEISAKLGPRTP